MEKTRVSDRSGNAAESLYDCLIIGGGPAGLSAAAVLARQNYRVALFDQNTTTKNIKSHFYNSSTWDHQTRGELYETAHRSVLLLSSAVRIEHTAITHITQANDSHFEVADRKGVRWNGRKVILAAGVNYLFPDIPGYEECWEATIYPNLLWYNRREMGKAKSAGVLAIGITGTPDSSTTIAQIARRHADNVTIYTDGNHALGDKLIQQITDSSIRIDTRAIARLEKGSASQSVTVHTEDCEAKTEDFLAHEARAEICGGSARQLGLDLNDRGEIKVTEPYFATSINGVFAVGDCACHIRTVVQAMATGALGATGVAIELIADSQGDDTPDNVLTQPHQLPVIMKDSDKHLKAPGNNSGSYMYQLLGQCVGLISGREWRVLRAVTEVPFGHRAVFVRADDVRRQVSDYIQDLERNQNSLRGLVHPAEDLKMLPFWIVAKVFYGPLPPHLTHKLSQLAPLRERVFKYIVRGGLARFSWARYLPTAANAHLREFKQAWEAFNTDALLHAQANNPEAPIISMHAAVVEGRINKDQLLQTLDEALYANLDVTTGGLSWNLVFLAANLHVQKRLRNEIAEAESRNEIDTYILDSQSYLAACVLESSRLRPLAAFSVPQAAPTDRDVDGYVIPAGTSFVVDAYALNVRNGAWSPDNTTYRPDRFLGGRSTKHRYLFWRFGFGPRQCMGKHVADLIIRSVMVELVRHYELNLLDGAAWERNRDSWITHPDFLLRCVKIT
ncbi:cytochrome P450 [Xylariales sp. AK1849]|nr:cytochrome P450 [Xylariales sp. AK1849]